MSTGASSTSAAVFWGSLRELHADGDAQGRREWPTIQAGDRAAAIVLAKDVSLVFKIALAWEAFKVWLTDTLPFTHHDYHLMLGVLLTLGLGWVLRRPLGSWLPLLIVFGLEMVNEVLDFTRYYLDDYPWGPGPALIDIVITMLPPLVIVLAARWEQACVRQPLPEQPTSGQ